MKKLLSILLALIITLSAFMGFGFSVSAENSDVLAVTVDGVTTNVNVGDTFRYTMTLSDVQIVNCQAEVYFDNSFVKVTTVDENDEEAYDAFITENFPIVYDSVIFNTDLTEKILVNCSRVNKYRFDGEQTLFSFEFTALAAGETTISTTMIEMAKSVTEFYVDKTPDGPVLVEEYTSAEFVTYEAPEEPSTEEPSTEEPSTEEPSTEEPSPVKVTNITTTPTDTNMAFKWDLVEDGFKYWVYKYDAETDVWASVASSYADTAVVKKLEADTEYQFKVICKLNDGTMLSLDDADVITAKTNVATATASIEGVADVIDATITWDAVEGATKYWVYKATSADGPFYIYSSAYETSLQVTKLKPDTDYYFRVVALTYNNGVPTISDVNASPTVHIRTLSAETVTTYGYPATANTATIFWSQFKNADKYWILYSTTSADTDDKSHWTTLVSTTDMTNLRYTYTNLKNNTTYYFTVCARYTTDSGEVKTVYYAPVETRTLYSDEPFLSFTPVDDTTLTVTLPDDLDIQKAWVYAIDEDGMQKAVVSTTTNTATFSNLSNYTNYTFDVQVLDNKGKYGYITPVGGESYHN